MDTLGFSLRCGLVLVLAVLIKVAVGCSGERTGSPNPNAMVDEILNPPTTNQLVVLPEQAGSISVVEHPRPRHVFSEGAYRALVISHGDDVLYFPFPQTSAGTRTHVDVYRITSDIYLLRDTTSKGVMDFVLDARKGSLFFRVTEKDRSFVYLVAGSPAPSLEEALQPNDLSTISASAVYPVGATEPVLKIGRRPMQPLPQDYAGTESLVGTIIPKSQRQSGHPLN